MVCMDHRLLCTTRHFTKHKFPSNTECTKNQLYLSSCMLEKTLCVIEPPIKDSPTKGHLLNCLFLLLNVLSSCKKSLHFCVISMLCDYSLQRRVS